jgi:hypothetical protein
LDHVPLTDKVEVIDALCPAGPWLNFTQAEKLAAVCEEVAALYERGGSVHSNGLGLSAKPASLKDAFWTAVKTAAHDDARTA